MPKCQRCKKTSLLLKLADGLCRECRTEVDVMTPVLLESAQCLADKVNKTDDPATFFSNYKLLIQNLKKLAKDESYVDYSGRKPSAILDEVTSREKYFASVLDMIDRAKAANKLHSYTYAQEMSFWRDRIPPDLWQKIETKFSSQNVPLFIYAVDCAIVDEYISTSFVQRTLRVGYMQASKIMEEIESHGLVEPWSEKNHGQRKLLISATAWQQIRPTLLSKDASGTLPSKMDGHQFEHYCADLLLQNGFTNATVTQASGDFGVDVLAEKDGVTYGIQCKYYMDKVGNHAVQEALSGAQYYHCMVAAVMTNNYFTPAAIETAKKTNVLLWDREKLADFQKSTLL